MRDFQGYHQCDAQEFLQELLNKISEELWDNTPPDPHKWEEDSIDEGVPGLLNHTGEIRLNPNQDDSGVSDTFLRNHLDSEENWKMMMRPDYSPITDMFYG